MKILRIIGIIIEVIIAIAIFIILAQKTPLFERIISKSSINPTEQTAILTGDTVEKKKSPNSTGSTAIKKPLLNTDPVPVEVIDIQGCTTPWGKPLGNNQSITAYAKSDGGDNNICDSELRVCHQGKLSGRYTLPSCNFIVDGRRNGKDIITGSSNSVQNIGDGAVKFDQYLENNQQYIQPKQRITSKELTYADTQPRSMGNSDNISYSDNQTDYLDQQGLGPRHNNDTKSSCMAPRGQTVRNGTFIYAYDIDHSDIQQTCKLQKRACINGKLSGTFTKRSCDDNISQKNQISDTLQSLAWKENDRLLNLKDPIINNGTLSPGGPRKISLSDLIKDSIYVTKYGTKSIRARPRTTPPYPLYTGHYEHTTIHTNTQNYIAYANCTSPRGTTLQNKQYITAYRNKAVEWNSLCDSEVRVCRDGRLRGSFQYKSCNPNTKYNRPTHRINTATNNVGNRTVRAVDNTGSRVSRAVKNVGKFFKKVF